MKKNTLIMLALTVLTLSIVGCGNQADTSAESTTKIEESVAASTENVPESDADVSTEVIIAEVETETTEKESTEEMVTETIAAEPEVEMVDFETWAKQEGNEEVCLVVWNEELGVQEILPPFQEKEEIYIIHDGDRFAIPYNKNIRAVRVDKEEVTPPLVDYREISVSTGGQVVIIFENQAGELETINYLF